MKKYQIQTKADDFQAKSLCKILTQYDEPVKDLMSTAKTNPAFQTIPVKLNNFSRQSRQKKSLLEAKLDLSPMKSI